MNIWTGIVLGVIGLSVWGLSKLSYAGGEIVTEVKARIFSIDFSKLVLSIDVDLKNPSGTDVTIKYPFIFLSYSGNVIASSEQKDEDVLIPKYGHKTIYNIKIPLNYLYMGGIAKEVLMKLKDKNHKIKVQIGVTTSVRFGMTVIPYKKVQDVEF